MSYGIEIKNSDNHVIIDDKYPNLLVTHSGIASSGASYPPPNTVETNGDIVMIQPRGKTSGTWSAFIENPLITLEDFAGSIDWSEKKFGTTNPFPLHTTPASYNYKLLKSYGLTKATSGYGLEIYDETGNGVIFSSELDNNMEIVAVGNVTASTDSIVTDPIKLSTYYIPAGDDINDYFVMANTMSFMSYEIYIGPIIGGIDGGIQIDNITSYAVFHYDGTQRIEFWSHYQSNYIIGKFIS